MTSEFSNDYDYLACRRLDQVQLHHSFSSPPPPRGPQHLIFTVKVGPALTVTGHIQSQAPQPYCTVPGDTPHTVQTATERSVTTDEGSFKHMLLLAAYKLPLCEPTSTQIDLAVSHHLHTACSTVAEPAHLLVQRHPPLNTNRLRQMVACQHQKTHRPPAAPSCSCHQPWRRLPYKSTAAVTAAITSPPTAALTDHALLLAGCAAAPAAGVSATALAGAPATAFAALASMLSGRGCCCGAHCALGPASGRRPISSTHALTISLEVGGTRAWQTHASARRCGAGGGGITKCQMVVVMNHVCCGDM
jgi:hypothetical protein